MVYIDTPEELAECREKLAKKRKAKMRRYASSWYLKNKTEIDGKHRLYYKTHKNEIAERCHDYYEKNKPTILAKLKIKRRKAA
jgi:hypothetical protein